MTVHIGPMGILLLVVLLVVAFSCLWSRYREALTYVHFYRHTCEDLHVFMLRYDVENDEVQLGLALSHLLQLPRHLRHYSRWSEAASKNPQDNRYYIVRCLQAYDDDRLYRFRCQEQKLHWFQLHSYMFRNRQGWAENVIGVFKDVTNQFNNEAELTTKAQTDSLTRLHNSSATRAYLATHVGHSLRAAVLLIDVDYFKRVNDTFGHQAGDRVLQLVADAIRYVMQGRGYLGRLGGDEFCCYLHELRDEDNLEQMCEQLNHKVTSLCLEEQIGMSITVSVGAAVLETGISYENAYSRVDTALYQAKRLGRNSYYVLKEERKVPAPIEEAETKN